MEGMGLEFTRVIVRCLLVPLSIFRPMTGTSCSPNREFNPPLVAHPPHHPPHPLMPTHLPPITCAIRDITVVVKKLLKIQWQQLASRTSYKTLAKRLFQLYSVFDIATIQHKKTTVVLIFELVILEIPNVTSWSVFQNQVNSDEDVAIILIIV